MQAFGVLSRPADGSLRCGAPPGPLVTATLRVTGSDLCATKGVYADRVAPWRPDMRGATAQLTVALEAAHDFAVRQAMDTWPE